jgi:hypothetical protein
MFITSGGRLVAIVGVTVAGASDGAFTYAGTAERLA